MSDDESKESSQGEYWKGTMRRFLGIQDEGSVVDDETEDLRARFARLSKDKLFAAAVSISAELSIQSGVAMATMQEVFPHVRVKEFEEQDYTSLCRTWDPRTERLSSISSPVVRAMYDAIRKAALHGKHAPSLSGSNIHVQGHSPVLLAKGVTDTVSEEAYLCPATDKTFQCDTWLYVASAVLGLPYQEKTDRDCLIRAIRGSCTTPDEPKKATTTMGLPGLKRCPFNLVSFASQKHWFDVNRGVMILPCMTMEEAKNWDGSPYSVLVVCSDGKSAQETNTTAAHMAQQIQLPSADLLDATTDDLQKAHSILKQALKASAFALKHKPGPEGPARKLWSNYQNSLKAFLSGVRVTKNDHVPDNGVPVPSTFVKPRERLASKIDLGTCAASGLQLGDEVAIPDPMLLAFKSSINWTREYDFQLMADAEPIHVQQLEQDGLDGVSVMDDDKSWVSALSAATLSLS